MSESSEGPTAADRELSASRAARILYQGWMCLSPGVGAAAAAFLGSSGDYLDHFQSVQPVRLARRLLKLWETGKLCEINVLNGFSTSCA